MKEKDKIALLDSCPVPGHPTAPLLPGTTATIIAVDLTSQQLTAVWDFWGERTNVSLFVYIAHLKYLVIP